MIFSFFSFFLTLLWLDIRGLGAIGDAGVILRYHRHEMHQNITLPNSFANLMKDFKPKYPPKEENK